MEPRLFSLIIPAFRQERTIERNLFEVEEILKKLPFDYEIIVVVDGMLDDTSKIVRKIMKQNKKIKLYENEINSGKGYSVKLGVSKAKGDIIGFIDAGFDLDPEGIVILLDFMKLHDADIVVGSKLHPDSVVNYPFYRRILSFFTRRWTQFIFGFSVIDTQVGLKIFKRKVAKDVFPRLLVKKFAFDIEMLAVANVLGYTKIYEAPIRLNFEVGGISRRNLLTIILLCFWDTLAIFYRVRILKYYRKSNRKNWLT